MMTTSSNSRGPTIRDVAAEANVSISTVSLYIRERDRVTGETGRRIAAAIEKIGYIPRPRVPSKSDHKFVGFLVEKLPVPVFSDIFYGQVINGLETAAREQGYSLLFAIVENDQLPPMVTENQVSGLLFLGGSPTNDALIRILVQRELPLVLVDNYIPGLPVHAVVPDNAWGAYAAFKHLLELGHRRIAIIEGPRKYKTLTDRLYGALRAAEDHGLTLPPEYRQPSLSAGRLRKGYREMKQLLSLPQPPTAVFAISDKTALGAYEAIKEAGLKIPNDISIVGFDDVVETDPPLTTVHVPKYEMGVMAMQQLLNVIEDEVEIPIRTSLYTGLVVRDSTSPPRGMDGD
jgi:LacI family transcriptional regulator